jgi:hypothetical protein
MPDPDPVQMVQIYADSDTDLYYWRKVYMVESVVSPRWRFSQERRATRMRMKVSRQPISKTSLISHLVRANYERFENQPFGHLGLQDITTALVIGTVLRLLARFTI